MPKTVKVQRTEIVDVTVVIPHQVPTIQTVQNMMEVAELSQHLDRVVDVPVAMQQQISMMLKVSRMAEIPEMPFIDSRVSAARVPVA